MLEALNPRFAEAEQVAKDDPRIVGKFVEYPSPEGYGTVKGYLVEPAKAQGKLPTVLVVHENRGLNPHIEDIARRLALDNFIAFAPDALAPLGGYPGDEDKARELFPKLDQAKTRKDFILAARVLKALPGSAMARWASSASVMAAASRIFWRRSFPISRRPFLFTARSRRPKKSPRSRRRCSSIRRQGRPHQRRLAGL